MITPLYISLQTIFPYICYIPAKKMDFALNTNELYTRDFQPHEKYKLLNYKILLSFGDIINLLPQDKSIVVKLDKRKPSIFLL